MMLQYRSKTHNLQHGTKTVHPAFVQCIVQGLPPRKSPGDTVQPDVAQAVLPTMCTQFAHANSVVLYMYTAARLVALTSVKHRHTYPPCCESTYDVFLSYTATYGSLDTLVSVLSLYQFQQTLMLNSTNVLLVSKIQSTCTANGRFSPSCFSSCKPAPMSSWATFSRLAIIFCQILIEAVFVAKYVSKTIRKHWPSTMTYRTTNDR